MNQNDLAAKLKEMYPEIEEHSLEMDLEFNAENNYWVVKLSKGDHRLHTLLDQKDAEACLEGTQCVYLGVQIGQFVKNFEYYA